MTAGAGNPVVATGELLGALALSLLGLLLPLLGAAVVIVLLVVMARRAGRLWRDRHRTKPA